MYLLKNSNINHKNILRPINAELEEMKNFGFLLRF